MQNKVNRAAQFMPFDALKGFREALKTKEKEVIEKSDVAIKINEKFLK